MDMILGRLEGGRLQAVRQAFDLLSNNRGVPVPYSQIRDTFDPRRHPDVCNGKKTEQEAITDFLEIFEMHHNTFNNYQKQDKVSKDEFFEFYRVQSCYYDDDMSFIQYVKGVWGVKMDKEDVSNKGWAGGNDTAVNGRDRYQKANFNKQAPFGTSESEVTNQWNSTQRSNFTGKRVEYG